MANRPFFIDIYNSAGNKVAALVNITFLNTTERLNAIGEAHFQMPANDEATRHIVAGSEFQIFDEVDGDLGRFLYRTSAIMDDNNRGILNVSCWSVMQELARQITGFAREYEGDLVEDIVDDLVSTVAGWTSDTDLAMGNANVTYQGQSIIDALVELANRWNYDFRMGSTVRELEFKTLGQLNTNVRLIGARGQAAAGDSITSVAFIGSIVETTEYDGIVNRVIALGAGDGAGQLTLANQTANRHGFVVQSIVPLNGQEYFFIEDAASVTANGLREIPIIFEDIKPIANTVAAKVAAANELMFAAEAYILRHRDPRIQYDIGDVRKLRADIQVGDLINIEYKGIDGNFKYLDVDVDYWLMDLQRDRDSASGDRVARMTLTNIDRRRADDAQMWKQLTKRIRSQKLLINPTPFRFENTYYDLIQSVVGAAGKSARFTISIDNTVQDLTRVIIRFKTRALFSPIGAIINPAHSAGAGTTVDVAFVAQEHDQFPRDISCELNGVNIDNNVNVDYLVGGTGSWNPDPANVSVTVEMDVTDLILADAGGIYQDFDIEFTCDPTSVAQDITMQGNTTTSTGASQGMIECTIKIQGIAQAIYRST